ncbi:cation-transporting P-type ATPase, partial [Acinetobacter baumannii]
MSESNRITALRDLAGIPAEAAPSRLGSDPRGLTAAAAEERLHRYGPNVLVHTARRTLLRELVTR